MFKKLLLVCLVVMFVFFTRQTHKEPQLAYNSISHRLMHPFDTRVRYRIGDIDTRFGLTSAEIKQLSAEAVAIWQKGTGREWFVYDDNAKLTVNLIYDERQAESNARADTEHKIGELQAVHQQNLHNIESERNMLNAEFAMIDAQMKDWQMEFDLIRQKMANSTPDEYNALVPRYNELLAKQQELNSKAAAYQIRQDAFNQSVESHNQQANALNKTIDDANIRFAPKEFHKGQFNGKRIEIFEFRSKDELRLTLAHEFGHALSIGHNDDPTALMYPYAQKQDLANFSLKPADIVLLNNRSRYNF